MKYQRRLLTLEERELPPTYDLLERINADAISAGNIIEELNNLEVKHIRLDGDDLETLCVTARYRGADCVFMMHRQGIGKYSFDCGVLTTTPPALQPTLEQCQVIAPWLTAIAVLAYGDIPEETNG